MRSKLFLIAVIALFSTVLKAGVIEYGNFLTKANIVASKTIDVSDYLYRDYPSNSLTYGYKVTLKYGRNDLADLMGAANWAYQVNYTVRFYDIGGTLKATSSGNSLVISNSSSPAMFEAVKLFQSGYNYPRAVLTVDGVVCTSCSGVSDIQLQLTAIKNKTSVDEVNLVQLPLLGYNNTSSTVYWSFLPGAESYELEWVFIDSLDLTGSFTTPVDPFIFKEPTKIITSKQHFLFSNTYPSGTVYFRVRGVGYFYGTTSLQYGNWSYGDYATIAQCKISKTNFEYNKNWQYTTTFAEDGKYKKVLTYYDGSLRNRQSLVNISTDTTVIVSEVKYDYEGRGVVNVMPVPLATNSLKYNIGLNRFTKDSVSAFDNKLESFPMDSVTGAARYYSYNNPFNSSVNRDFIPNAEGYPYSQVIYTNDNTGRVAKQMGVGKVFHHNSQDTLNRVTKYFYGSPSDTELKKLFGTNVGVTSHYKKNMIVDPNGQISIQMLDQEGRVVATALGGRSPKNLSPLLSNVTLATDTTSLNKSNKIDTINLVSRSTSKILNMMPNQNYSFNYDLTGIVNTTGLYVGGNQICKTCKYDLKVTVIDPNGNDTIIVKSLNPPSVTCGTASYSVTRPNLISIPFTEIGDYTIIKELTLSSGAIDTLLTSVRSSTAYPNYNTILTSYLSKVDSSMCDLTCQDHCTTQVFKNHPTWTWANNAIQINASIDSCMTYNCGAIIDREVKTVSRNDCESSKQQMLEQLSPGGYYNTKPSWLETNLSGVVFHNKDGSNRSIQPTVDTLRMSNYFESQWATDLLSKHPEYGHLLNCYGDSLSKDFDKNLSRVPTWQKARSSGYLNPLWMTSGEGYTFGTATIHDPFFEGTGRGTGQRSNIVTKLKNYKNESTDGIDYNHNGSIGGTVTMWTYSIYIASENYTKTPIDSNKAWSIFQGLYMGEKQNSAIAATATAWQPTGASFTIFQKPIAPPQDTSTMNSINYSQLQGACRDVCDENVKVWMNMLKAKCNLTWAGTDSLKIADSLKTYCLGRCGFDNPFALLIAQDVAVNSTLNYINTSILPYYGCKLDSITTVEPCAHRTTKSTTVTLVTKEAFLFYELINDILDSLARVCTVPNSNCISQFIQKPLDPKKFPTYNKNKSIFDNYSTYGALDSLKLTYTDITHTNIQLNFHYVGMPTYSYYIMTQLSLLKENGISELDKIKSISNVRINPIAVNTVLLDIEFFDRPAIAYPLVTIPAAMNGVPKYSATVSQIKTFSVCDSINASNSTFNFVLDFKKRRDSCISEQKRIATSLANTAYQDTIQKYESAFLQKHFNKCFKSPFAENFYYISKQPQQYHYTLYYYDQAGNLVQTVPPAGVDTLARSNFNKGTLKNTNNPAHRLITKYKYNALNQLIWQYTPDGGATNFYYNEKGQLRLSQNAKQKKDTAYSYIKYDEHGRIIQVGLLKGGFALTYDSVYFYNTANNAVVMAWLNDPYFPALGTYSLKEMTTTTYDTPFGAAPIAQQNIRNRVSRTVYSPDMYNDETKTYYSYDIHGNVEKIAQTIPGLGSKTIDYEYDLISGNVKKVSYQKGQVDAFYHKYQYDADNRVVSVKTSSDGVIWDQDAYYKYYKHGSLARTELGEYKVQGLDYYYTLQGWLKGINTPHFQTSSATSSGTQYVNILDPGKDGIATATLNKFIAQDEFQMSLGYYQGDYKGISSNASLGAGREAATTNLYNSILGYTNKKGLYNGNISWMITDMRAMYTPGYGGANNALSTRAMAYQYDQLNRLVGGYSYGTYSSDAAGWSVRSAGRNPYDFRAKYDPNGNISELSRVGSSGTNIDSLLYNYNKFGSNLVNNRLRNITDLAGYAGAGDIGTQSTDNYGYDEIGNMIRDDSSQIKKITWNVYGKVQKIERTTGSLKDELEFMYDATGNRVVKIRKPRTGGVLSTSKNWEYTYYVRDASGNVMATYTRIYQSGTNEHFYTLSENAILGSARIGLRTPGLVVRKNNADNGNVTFTASLPATLGRFLDRKRYELNDHLGNVRVYISDQPRGFDTNSDGKADYYLAILNGLTDYGPFGEPLPGRKYVGRSYRYGFNGKERDDEGMGGGESTYDYGFRIYNPQIARFLSVDPLTSEYPWYTPYQFAGNTPIWAVDLDGLEELKLSNVSDGFNLFGEKINEMYQNAKANVVQGATNLINDPKGTIVKKAEEVKDDAAQAVTVVSNLPSAFYNGVSHAMDSDSYLPSYRYNRETDTWEKIDSKYYNPNQQETTSLLNTGDRVTGLKGVIKPDASDALALAKITVNAVTSFSDVASYIKKNGKLPSNFISKADAQKLGWKPKQGNLAQVAPGKSIGGDVFLNLEGKLPAQQGRTWYEADINYSSGYRGDERILYSSDGLIYQTTDHYKSFVQIQ